MNSINKLSTLDLLQPKKEVKSPLPGDEFSKILEKTLSDQNAMQKRADKASADIATGEVKDLHQAAIAISKAETSMKLMLEIRNKALSAYKEISRTQI
ncbi:MAG: flagellar hook-basal body complex protein FliE [Campylobacteraceae bacterium]|nr:flagellar hook-basal body complex protein FliE [Campylobacteraceae bacterium]